MKLYFFLPGLKFIKCPQTKFQVDAMRGFKVITSKKGQNSALGQNFSFRHFLLFDIFVKLRHRLPEYRDSRIV